MKLFLIKLDSWGYDDYNSCVLVAESYEQVKDFCDRNFCNKDE